MTETSAEVIRSNEWCSIGEYSLKGISTVVNLYNQFIGTRIPITESGLFETRVTIHNPQTNVQLLLYNRTTSGLIQVNVPKSNTPTRVTAQLELTSQFTDLESRIRINPTEIGQYIYIDDWMICKR